MKRFSIVFLAALLIGVCSAAAAPTVASPLPSVTPTPILEPTATPTPSPSPAAEETTVDPFFEPADALGSGSGDRNFFLSANPQLLQTTALYTFDMRQYLCRAPINGNANLYWAHTNQTAQPLHFGILLQNLEAQPLTITVRADCVQSINDANDGLALFAKKGDFTAGLAGGEGKQDVPLTLQPGQAAWLTVHTIDTIHPNAAGLVSVSIENGAYTGRNLICTTYAYTAAEYTDAIPIHTADWEVEAAPNGNGARGSGNGALYRLTGDPATLPVSLVLHDETEMLPLTRLENNRYFTLENQDDVQRIACDTDGNLPDLTEEEQRFVNERYSNLGMIHQIDTAQLQAEYHLQDGKKVIGELCLSDAATDESVSVALWRTKNGVLDFTETVLLAPQEGENECRVLFDPNVPFYDDASYQYYVACSDKTAAVSLSFSYADIPYESQAMTVYIDDVPVVFADVWPQLIDGFTMVPLRGVFENLGASLDYSDGIVSVFLPGRIMTAEIGNTHIMDYDTVNKIVGEHEINTAPILRDNRTLVPLRAFSELMGLRVIWAHDVQQIFMYHQ